MIQEYLSYNVLNICMAVYNELGPGFLEPVYQEALSIALQDANVQFIQEAPLTIYFRGRALEKKYYADFLIEDKIILELKAVARILPQHKAQLMNYLKATGIPVGYLLNFHGNKLTWDRIIAKDEWMHPLNNSLNA